MINCNTQNQGHRKKNCQWLELSLLQFVISFILPEDDFHIQRFCLTHSILNCCVFLYSSNEICLQERRRGGQRVYFRVGKEEDILTVQGRVSGWKKELHLFLEHEAPRNSRRSTGAFL